MQIILVWLWNLFGFILDKYNQVRDYHRKRFGDWKWINLESSEPQILHIYYVRPGAKYEPWKCETYQRWNNRLEQKKTFHGSEWYIPQLVSKYDGIVVHYRFRKQEWFDSFSWSREMTDKKMNILDSLRTWVFPKWNSDTWKSSRGMVKFPSSVVIEGKEINMNDWRGWFGPEGRSERLLETNQIVMPTKRNFETYFDITRCIYMIQWGDIMKIDWGLKEEDYQWGLSPIQKKSD